MEPPQNPAGPYVSTDVIRPERRHELIGIVAAVPTALAAAVAGLGAAELDTKYRNWTVRQIVHHLADSHANAYIRCRLALTEHQPTIKPYDEGRWADLPDAKASDVAPSLVLLTGLHARWVGLFEGLDEAQFARTFFHPESRQVVPLAEALSQYAWHGQHHTAQIVWLREQRGWPLGEGRRER